MNTNFTEQQSYVRAQKRVKEIKGFYSHLIVYCVVISAIIYINLTFSPQFHWFWFSLSGWGLGLFIHWFAIFGFNMLGIGKDWEERKIKEFMNQNNTTDGK